MKQRRVVKRLLIFVLSICLVAAAGMIDGSFVEAKTNTAQQMVKTAKNLVGKTKFQLGLTGDWCARFARYCAKESGNSSLVGKNGYVGLQAQNTVNDRGGKITFVNKTIFKKDKSLFKSERCSYNKKYKPKPGDLVIYNWYGDTYSAKNPLGSAFIGKYILDHVGVVISSEKDNTPDDFWSVEGNTGPNYSVVQKKHRKNERAIAFVTPKYKSAECIHTYKDSKGKFCGKCVKCGVYFKDTDKAKLTPVSGRYKYNTKTYTKVFPNDYAYNEQGTIVNHTASIIGKYGNDWYKVKTSGKIGTAYIRVQYVSPDNPASTLKVTASNISIKEGKPATISGQVTSNYEITKIYGSLKDNNTGKLQEKTINQADFGTKKTSVKIADSKIDTNLKCGNLSAGTHTLTIKAWDSSGATKTATATVTVDGDVKAPSFGEEKPVAGGKEISISKNNNQAGAVLWYQVNNQTKSSTTSATKTIKLSSSAQIKAWCELNGKTSSTVTKEVTISKLLVPYIDGGQIGDTIDVVLKSDTNSAKIIYQIGTSGWKSDYTNGKTISLTNGQVLQYYAKADGYINSDVDTFVAELTEPDTPEIKLIGTDSTIAVGKAVSVAWARDWKAEKYTATLYRKTDDDKRIVVETIETDDPSVSFKLAEEGGYCIDVVGVNDLGESEASNTLSVTAKGPSTVEFYDAADDGSDEDHGALLAAMTVTYNEKIPERITPPSRRGHTFLGWEDIETGEVSENNYMKRAIKEDTVFVAKYEKNKYKVRFYAPDGRFIISQETEFGSSAITDDVLDAFKAKDVVQTGEAIKGWSVLKTDDEQSLADVTAVDANMYVQAAIAWENDELPVTIDDVEKVITSLDDRGGILFKPQKVHITTAKDRKTDIYLIATLKEVDEETGVERALYSDRRVFTIPKGESGLTLNANENDHDFDLPVSDPERSNAVTRLELVAVEREDNGATGSTYSNAVMCDKIEKIYYSEPKPENWTFEKPEEQEGRVIETKMKYRYRTKDYISSGEESVAGYTSDGSITLSSTTSDWIFGSPSYSGDKITRYSTYYEVENSDDRVVGANKLSCKFCKCGKTYAENNGTLCKYCNTKTDTDYKLKVFCKGNISGKTKIGTNITIKPTGSYTGTGYVCAIKYGEARLSSYTSKGDLYLWPDAANNNNLYRTRTKRIANRFYKLSDWSGDPDLPATWSDTAVNEVKTGDHQVEVQSKTVYRYRDLIPAPPATTMIDDNQVQGPFEGNLLVDGEDLNGKKGTVMVYQTINSDPNTYQMQYTGQITFETDEDNPEIGKNHYSFSFIPKDIPSADRGNYIVSIGVQGITGLVTVGVIEAPREEHDVTVYYTGNNGVPVTIAKQKVLDGDDLDMSQIDIPDREGFVFAGWSGDRITNIKKKSDIEAIYKPVKNAVVLVDWVNQTIDLQMKETGEKVILPEIDIDSEDSPYKFKGWKKEDGTYITGPEEIVTGNMIIIADYEPAAFTVRFVGLDGETVDTQEVQYHESANPPGYDVPGSTGVFAGWSTAVNWWSVEENVVVRPIVVHDEQAMIPESDVITDEDTGERSVVLETEEEGADIFYTTDGETPTIESIQEYLQTDPDEYAGSIRRYTSPITFASEDMVEEDDEAEGSVAEMEINAVTYVEGKNTSDNRSIVFEKSIDPDEVIYHEEYVGWEEIGEFDVKAKAGKDVRVMIDLEENPGLKECDFLIEGDKDVFYPDCDEYGDPLVEEGGLAEQGTTFTSDLISGWRYNWSSTEVSTASGRLFALTIHVNEEAEEGIYPISVSYSPDNTLDENYDPIELDTVKVSIDSEASIQIDTLESALSRTSYVYEGIAHEPTVLVDGLKENTDFTVEYKNNVDVGTATATITGIGDYAGTVEKEFTITQANIANAEVAPIDDQTYSGRPVEPDLSVTFNGQTLEKDKDYEAVFSNNTEVGTADVAIKGIGNFKGNTEAQFTILETLESRLALAEEKLQEAEAAIAELSQAKEAAEAEAAAARNAQKAAEDEAASVRAALENAQSEAEEARLEKEAMAADLAAAVAAQATAEAEANTAKLAQKEAEARADAAELQTQTAQAQLDQIEAELADAIAARDAAEADAAASNSAKQQAQARVEELTNAKAAIEAELAAAVSNKETAEAQLAQAQADKEEADKQVEKLTKDVEELEKKLDEATSGGSGEDPVSPDQKAADIADIKLNALMNAACSDEKITLEDAAVVKCAKEVYDTLTKDQKELIAVDLRNKVEFAQLTVSQWEKYKENVAAAKKKTTRVTVKAKIGARAAVTLPKGRDGYQIRFSLSKNFKSGVKTKTLKRRAYKATIKRLKKGKTYYVQARPITIVKNEATGTSTSVKGAWSKTKRVKITK